MEKREGLRAALEGLTEEERESCCGGMFTSKSPRKWRWHWRCLSNR
ncbi:hypothetical protein [Anaerotignum sp.]